jgi:UDP-N-acetylmuramyl tripeptide synthase
MVALRIDPQFVTKLTAIERGRFTGRTIVLSGTNGKTTTARLIASILQQSGARVVANQTGANLVSGLASALAFSASLTGHVHADYLVLEADEHALPRIVAQTAPQVVLLTNLFRDQLDRFGEIEHIAAKWRDSLSKVSKNTTVVINANDPHLAALQNKLSVTVVTFGVDRPEMLGKARDYAVDTIRCPECRGPLHGDRFMSHLGLLRCSECSFVTPKPTIALVAYDSKGLRGSKLTIQAGRADTSPLEVTTSLIGRFNALNVTAAVAVARTLEIATPRIVRGIEKTSRAFGRSESFSWKKRQVYVHLAKNPTGYNEILEALSSTADTLDVVLALNDNWADGQDVSWIWDVGFEDVASKLNVVTASGQRAGDIAVRIWTAGIDQKKITLEPDVFTAVRKRVTEKSNQPLHIIATYTAMIFLRDQLVAHKLVPSRWEAA